jgi:DNA (cytosine-5)-methyltransferase 1
MRSLELFSGAGGLAKGLEQAGFLHSAFVEFNTHACASLQANFHPEKVFHGDIKNFDLGALSGIDVVAGGPPCQPFSLGGKHKAHDDSRDMFPYAIAAIERLSPKAFVFENVKGLLRASFADYFEYILLRLTYPGFKTDAAADWRAHLALLKSLEKMPYTGTQYHVQFKLLNAADFGVPQTRERVVIVGVRSDIGCTWDFPAATHSEDRLVWDMQVSGDYWRRHGLVSRGPIDTTASKLRSRYGMFAPTGLPWQTVRDALADVPDPQSQHGIADHVYRGGARTYPGHTGSDIDWPAKTIKAGGHGVPGGENMVRYEDGSVRYFTVFEAKRIQTFPDDFQITGAWGEAMRQIGNAVPVQLASVLGQQLWRTLAQLALPDSRKMAAGESRHVQKRFTVAN